MPKKRVMVALRDRASVEELMDLACQLAAGMGADLIVFHVVQVPMATPLDTTDEAIDEEGQEILARAAKLAAGRVPADLLTQLVRARNACEAIVGEARDQVIDLLVIGHPRKHELSEFLLGSTARHVAHHAPCRVIVQIPAPNPPKTRAVSADEPVLLAHTWADCPGGIVL
jgi:nucleotide-binding universal stress UspA family protein